MSDSIEMIIYEKIKKEILLGTIDQEKNLSEASLSKETGYSRSPIRTALKQLEKEELITYKKNRGITLREAPIKEMVDATQICVNWMILAVKIVEQGLNSFDIPALKERLALAKEYRANKDYPAYINQMTEVYLKIMEASGNDLILSTYKTLSGRVISTSLYKKMSNPENAPKKKLTTVQFFQEFIELLEKSDYENAIQKLETYQSYATNQIIHYGFL